MIRRARLLLVVLLAATGVTACGPVDVGSGAGADFREWMAGTEHVERLDLRSNNDLPFTGTLWADVVVEPDATVAQIADVARRATSFESRASTTFTIGYTRGDFTARFAVFPHADAANLELIMFADHVDRTTAATELTSAEGSGIDPPSVTVVGPDDFLVLFDQLSSTIAAKDLRVGDLLTVRNEAETFSIAADRGTGAAGPRAAYEAVRAEYPITAAQLTGTTLDVRVALAETPAVVALAQRAAPSVVTTVQFGTVTKTDPGDYTAADALIAQLATTGPVLSAVLSPESARVTVADVATALAMFAAVGDGPTYDGVHLIFQTADGVFTVSALGEPIAAYGPVLDALSVGQSAPLLNVVTLYANDLDVRTTDLSDAQTRELGAALALTPVGTTIEVRPGASVGFRLVAAAQLTVESLDTFGEPSASEPVLVAAFVDGWSSTP